MPSIFTSTGDMVFKCYKRRPVAGSHQAYWEGELGGIDLTSADRSCEASPLWPVLVGSVKPDRLFIDGGCGAGQWVKYFASRGYRAAGVDFAEALVRKLNADCPELDIRRGDVRALPFETGEVHTYYSGGVAEHFEEGPEAVLVEARRVLAPDGRFLCSVPDAGPLRRRGLYRRPLRGLLSRELHIEPTAGVGSAPAPDRRCFHQYVFAEREFRARLESCGFEVVRSFGFSFMWALFEIRGVRSVHDGAVRCLRAIRSGAAGSGAAGRGRGASRRSPVEVAEAERSGGGSLRERALVREDDSIPWVGPAVRFLRENCAHMRMFVCRVR